MTTSDPNRTNFPASEDKEHRALHFGGFTLDLQRRGLYRGGERVHLTPKPFDTLAFLAQNHGRVAQKQELLDAGWKDAFVTEDTLVKAIREIRRVLEDDKEDPKFIQTVPGEGYRFVAEVTEGSLSTTRERQEGRQIIASSVEEPGGDRNHERIRSRWTSRSIWLGSSIFVLFVGIAAWVYIFRPISKSSHLPPFKVIRLTSFPGIEREPAISPDGKMIAFIWDGENRDQFDVYVKLIDAGAPIRLTTDPGTEYSPVWSPDGRYIAFGRTSEKGHGFYMVPFLGGRERQLSESKIASESTLDWSPDGKELAITDEGSPSDKTNLSGPGIFLLSVETLQKKRLTFPNKGCNPCAPVGSWAAGDLFCPVDGDSSAACPVLQLRHWSDYSNCSTPKGRH